MNWGRREWIRGWWTDELWGEEGGVSWGEGRVNKGGDGQMKYGERKEGWAEGRGESIKGMMDGWTMGRGRRGEMRGGESEPRGRWRGKLRGREVGMSWVSDNAGQVVRNGWQVSDNAGQRGREALYVPGIDGLGGREAGLSSVRQCWPGRGDGSQLLYIDDQRKLSSLWQ